MPGASILPVAFHKGKLYFLFGKENPMEDSAKGFSDFGGGIEKGESEYETAFREGGEELTGFLGDGEQLKQYMKGVGEPLKITHTDPKNPAQTYTVHIIPLKMDHMLPIYYNNNHAFLWNRMNKNTLNKTKLFEKIEIDWFCETDLKKRMPEYRAFYREVVKLLITKIHEIRRYIKKHNKTAKKVVSSRRKTVKRKQRGG
jgi:hypothetical protein